MTRPRPRPPRRARPRRRRWPPSCRPRSSPPARSSSASTRRTRPTSSSPRTARRSRAWTSTCSTRSRQKLGLKVELAAREVRLDHHRCPGRQVRRRRLQLHHQRRAQEAGQHGELLQRRHPVGHRRRATRRRSTRTTPAGIDVAVQKGTVQHEDDLPRRSKKCKAPASRDQACCVYTGQDQATAAVATGKADAMLADSPVVPTRCKQTGGKLEAARRHLRLGAVRLRRPQGPRPTSPRPSPTR